MSQTIWKFELRIAYGTTESVDMPVGAEVICARAQYSDVVLYAIVDPEAEKESRTFQVVGTGQRMPDQVLSYFGTAEPINGLILHVFEIKGP